MNPTLSDVHVNAPLTNISIAYLQNQQNFIADRVFPNIPVQKQADRYFVYDKSDFFRDEAEIRAIGSESAGASYKIDNTPTYYANVYALHKDVADLIRANADEPLDMDRDATEFITQKMLIKKEIKFTSSFLTTSIWGTDKTGSASPSTSQVYVWSDYTNSDPLLNIRTAGTTVHQNAGMRPNVVVMGQQVWDKLADHPDIIDRVKYGQTAGRPAMVSKEAVAQLVEMDEVIVAGAVYETAAENATSSPAFITGKTCLVAYRENNPGILKPSAGYTFSWNGMFGAGPNGIRIKKFRMDHLSSDRVEAEMAFDQKLIASSLGYFFNTIVA